MKNTFRILWLILGFLCLGLGTVGIVLPILPTVLYGNVILFCKKFGETAYLVYGNRFI